MKRLFTYMLFVVVLSVGLWNQGVDSVSAQSIADLQKELQELEKERKGINSESSQAKAKIDANEKRQEEVRKKIDEIDRNLEITRENLDVKQREINATNAEISSLEVSISNTEEQIDETEQELDTLATEIEDLVNRINERDVLIKNRLRSIQHNGGNINYLQVLFGAQSFGDFINRATALTKIADSDRTIMKSQERDKADLEEKRVAVELKKEQLVADKAKLDDQKVELDNQHARLVVQQGELLALQEQLNKQRSEQSNLMVRLEKEHQELEEYTVTLADQQEIKRTEAIALEKAIKLAEEQARLEQLAKQREKEEAARRAREEAARREREEAARREREDQQPSQPSPAPAPAPNAGADNGAILFWPASTRRVTSHYNPTRIHPITGSVSAHRGIDIAAPGYQSIYAAESGVVQNVYRENGPGMRGYGDAIMITHYIDIGNGRKQQVTTFYAHLRAGSISVKPGDVVTRGQQIAAMGNTGASTGQHLHFEVHIGGWAYGNARDPRNFLY